MVKCGSIFSLGLFMRCFCAFSNISCVNFAKTTSVSPENAPILMQTSLILYHQIVNSTKETRVFSRCVTHDFTAKIISSVGNVEILVANIVNLFSKVGIYASKPADFANKVSNKAKYVKFSIFIAFALCSCFLKTL